ncbi:sigma factor [Lactobacillus sp. ESL0731]|uniref:sigma factor n=1 Tax=unclassified Lactobacillus TaxID=2620435 RepID=UPI0023F92568|nr:MULTISPECIES: sigma factor [unclassified Lactobacillus]WEV50689.1 sigma factor [Lactobacillus sp. ESL0700]WEV61819.1 sigma factor [Lactobacillus sp. ESL0731]
MQLTEAYEQKLIKQVQAGSDDALVELCYFYRPLINSIKQKYFVRCYDGQDWDQDALIVCYQAAMSYEQGKGKFGSYFKTRLHNHARSLLRHDMAYRRRALAQATSLEAAMEKGIEQLHQKTTQLAEIPVSEKFTELFAQLSDLEIKTLLIALGVWHQEEVLQKLQIEQVALVRARSRLMQKMRKTLL